MTDYYVDSVNGLDSNDGLTSATPKASFTQVNALTGDQSGNTVSLAKGSTWRAALSMTDAYGSSGNPFVIRSYGTGANPVISGADIVTGAVLSSGAIYKLTSASNQDFHYNGSRVPKIAFDTDTATTLALMTSNSSFYDSGDTALYVWLSDGSDPNGISEVTARDQCIYITTSVGYVSVSGIHCEKARAHNINVSATGALATPAGIRITNNTVNYAGVDGASVGSDGILCYGTDATHRCSGGYIAGNIGSYNLNNLVELGWCDSYSVKHNTGDNNGGNLLELWKGCSTNSCESNINTNAYPQGNGLTTYHASFAWVNTLDTSTGNIFKSNISDGSQKGIHVQQGANTIVNNIIINAWNRVIDITDTATATVKNNIIGIDNGSVYGYQFAKYIYVATALASNDIDYNLYYDSTTGSGETSQWQSADSAINTDVFATWQAAADANSFNSDPLLDNDYRPQSGSDAIAGGVTVSGVIIDYDGNGYFATPDIGAYQKTNANTKLSIGEI